MLEELKERDYICRLNFCAGLRNNYSKLNNIFWSDEAYQNLDNAEAKALIDEITTVSVY